MRTGGVNDQDSRFALTPSRRPHLLLLSSVVSLLSLSFTWGMRDAAFALCLSLPPSPVDSMATF